ERVIVEGAEGDSMFVLLRGSANVSVAKNGAALDVGKLHSGDCFGEMSLLTGERRTATVRAAADCYVLEISKPVMDEVIRQSPECLNQLSELLAKRKWRPRALSKTLISPKMRRPNKANTAPPSSVVCAPFSSCNCETSTIEHWITECASVRANDKCEEGRAPACRHR